MVRQAIDDTNRQFVEAFLRGDAARCAAAYTEDAKILPPGSPMLRGKQAIQAFWQGAIDMGERNVALQTLDLEDKGDTAIEIGAYTLNIQPKGGQAMTDKGKYVVVWKRQADGSWKWAVDIWNSDSPPPA